MSIPQSWRLKIDRAYEHFTDAVTTATQFLERKPYRITSDIQSEPGKLRLWITLLEEPPDRISLAARDAVHNMRSALDHIVYEISSTKERDPRWTSFPIMDNEADWHKLRRGKLDIHSGLYQVRHLTPAAQTFVQNVQPCPRPDDFPPDTFGPDRERLKQLHDFDIADKHKSLKLAVFYLQNLAIGHDGSYLADWEYVHPGGPLKLNAPVPLFQFDMSNQGSEVDVKPIVMPEIAFSEGLPPYEPVPACLRELLRCVEHVIREVARLS